MNLVKISSVLNDEISDEILDIDGVVCYPKFFEARLMGMALDHPGAYYCAWEWLTSQLNCTSQYNRIKKSI